MRMWKHTEVNKGGRVVVKVSECCVVVCGGVRWVRVRPAGCGGMCLCC